MKYLICNLKANKLINELKEYEENIKEINENPEIEFIICPSTPFLYLFQSNKYKLGVQNVSKYNQGPYTGETTAMQLASLNVKYALIGHSERRQLFNEDEKTIIEKIKKSYHNGIRPIYFIGEKDTQKNKIEINKELEKQISHIINEIPDYKREKMIIVYEPVWAIGSGICPTNEEITNKIHFIKKLVKDYYDLNLPVLYGGSVNENNIEELAKIESLDGFVLGESAKEYNTVMKIYKKIV